jgi:hypothetical protein
MQDRSRADRKLRCLLASSHPVVTLEGVSVLEL